MERPTIDQDRAWKYLSALCEIRDLRVSTLDRKRMIKSIEDLKYIAIKALERPTHQEGGGE